MGRVTLPYRIALDTNVFIYGLEAQEPWATFVRDHVLLPLARGELQAVTSAITLVELATRPHRAGQPGRVDELLSTFRAIPNLVILPLDETLARASAHVRGESPLRLPDAVQVAAGIIWGADALLTNDQKLRTTRSYERPARISP